MAARRAYLDYNAATPIRPAARDAMARALALGGNPSSTHAEGRAARRIVEDSRMAVAALVGARPQDVIFTSGGTESNATALSASRRPRIVISSAEHDSVADAAPGAHIAVVDAMGRVDIDRMPAIDDQTVLSVMAANNETGVVQPIAALCDHARGAGGLFHCDAAQAPGKIAARDLAAQADYITLSAYKIGGPAGVGALIVRPGAPFAPLLRGGGQESFRRAGGENLAGVAGFGAAALDVAECGGAETVAMRALRDVLEEGVAAISPETEIIARSTERLPNTTCMILPATKAETAVMALDLDGVAVSAGAACSSGKIRPSRVLLAMGRSEDEAARAIRVSLGWKSEEADVRQFLDAFARLMRRRAA